MLIVPVNYNQNKPSAFHANFDYLIIWKTTWAQKTSLIELSKKFENVEKGTHCGFLFTTTLNDFTEAKFVLVKLLVLCQICWEICCQNCNKYCVRTKLYFLYLLLLGPIEPWKIHLNIVFIGLPFFALRPASLSLNSHLPLITANCSAFLPFSLWQTFHLKTLCIKIFLSVMFACVIPVGLQLRSRILKFDH